MIWDYLAFDPPGWGGQLLKGLAVSLQIAAGAYAFGAALGIAGAMGKIYGSAIVKDLLEIYTTIVRAVPELILILIIYYLGTDLLNRLMALGGLAPVDINGVAAGVFVIGLVQGAYATEVLRGAFRAIPYGEIEAARAFGMTPGAMLRRITIPAMLPHAIPGMGNLWLVTTKETALLAVVGFTELAMTTQQASATTKAYITFYGAACGLYLGVSLMSTMLLGTLEKRARRGVPKA